MAVRVANCNAHRRAAVRISWLGAALICIVGFVNGPAAARQDSRADCNNKDADGKIIACSAVIARGKRETSNNRAVAFSNRCMAFFQKGEFDRAIADCNQAIRLSPRNEAAHINLGSALLGKGDIDRAISNLTKAININLARGLTFSNRCAAWNEKREYDRALADCDQAIRLSPSFANGYINRSIAWLKKEEFDRSIADSDQAIRINPNDARAYNNRCNAWLGKNEPDRAIADCDLSARLDPRSPNSLLNRGNAWLAKGEYDRAIAEYDQAIRLDPNFDEAYNNRGYALAAKRELDRALTDYEKALRLNPNLAAGYGNRCRVWNEKRDFSRALADCDRSIRLNPAYTEAFLARGIANEGLGDLVGARHDYNAALAVPKNSYFENVAKEKARARLAALSTPPSQEARSGPEVASNDTSFVPTVGGFGRRVALVIGNSSYKAVSALANPRHDAEAVAAALRAVGFQTVTLETDLGKERFTAALRDFARQAERSDWALIYFAGHGIEIGSANYLIPVDASLETDRDAEFEAVPLRQVMSAVEGAKQLRLVMLDACRDNPFARQMRRNIASRSIGRGLARVEPDIGTLVVFAARDGEVALDGAGLNSPFATAFVKNIMTPGLEIRRLFDFVRDDVVAATNRRQQPFSYGSLPGRQDFFFVAR